MGIKRGLAKIAPKAISDKAIDKGEFQGDDWMTVSVVLQKMCKTEMKGKSVDLIYDDKVVGFIKQDGTSWCDDKAYVKIKEAFDALPEDERTECLEQAAALSNAAAEGLIPSHPRQVRELQNRRQSVEDEFGGIEDNEDAIEANEGYDDGFGGDE